VNKNKYVSLSISIRVILQSFCTSGMSIENITVYPSDFGLERMEYEAIHGPPKDLWEKKSKKGKDANKDKDEDKQGMKVDMQGGKKAPGSEESDEDHDEDEDHIDSGDEEAATAEYRGGGSGRNK
jgi:hypothetical protein